MTLGNGMARQSGFSLVAAIFILVILGMMGSYMVSTSVMQYQTTDYAVQGARAYKAAQSGLQWAIYQVINGTGNFTCGNEGAERTRNLVFAANGLNGFGVDVTCNWVSYTADNICMYRFTTEARFGGFGQPDFVSRRLEAVVSDAC